MGVCSVLVRDLGVVSSVDWLGLLWDFSLVDWLGLRELAWDFSLMDRALATGLQFSGLAGGLGACYGTSV